MILPDGPPRVARTQSANLERLRERTAAHPPADLAAVIRDELAIDLSTHYAGYPIAHPFGKASGQLSCTPSQVEADVESGLGFIVLKTVIAEDADGARAMDEWANPETAMRVEQRRWQGMTGWTVTWKGRGWSGDLASYLHFFREALSLGHEAGIPVVPSVKYHLATQGESYREAEYRITTQRLLEVWCGFGRRDPLPLEKDFSPTLAGDRRAKLASDVHAWLRDVPRLIDAAAPGQVRLGVKVMNTRFDDDVQLSLCRTLARRAHPRPKFLVLFNRLFDAAAGVAYGGWELSDRNLRVLARARTEGMDLPPVSATGNICSGRMMLEYALLGCENGQVHTFFQLPNRVYTATGGPRTARALHTLFLHPADGLVPWMWHLEATGHLERRDGRLRFADVVMHGVA